MNSRKFTLGVVLWILAARPSWLATVEEISEFGHHPSRRDGILKKRHSPISGRPPPSGGG